MTASPPIPPLWTDWPRLISQGREDAARRMRHSGDQTCMCVGGVLWHRALQKPLSTLGKILQHHKLTALIPHAYVTMDQAVKNDEGYKDLDYWLPSVAVGCGPCSSRHDLSKGIQRELEGGTWPVVKTARRVRAPHPFLKPLVFSVQTHPAQVDIGQGGICTTGTCSEGAKHQRKSGRNSGDNPDTAPPLTQQTAMYACAIMCRIDEFPTADSTCAEGQV